MNKQISFMRRGLTLVETMISLTVSASLLVSVAAAYNASSAAVTANADYFRAAQAARITMNQILNEIRQCQSVVVSSDHVEVIRTLEMLTPNEVSRTFQYNSAAKTVTLTIYGAGNAVIGGPYEMASNVSATTFGPAVTGTDSNNTHDVVQHLPVSITVTVGTNFTTLTGAAGPKRALASF